MKEKNNYIPEMREILEKSEAILNFISEKNPEMGKIAELTISEWERYPFQNSKKMLKGFREGLRDFVEIASSLSQKDYHQLNELLLSRFGTSLKDIDMSKSDILNKILKEDKIDNSYEYRVVMERIDTIYSDKNKIYELNSLNDILVKFEKRSNRFN